MKTVLKIKQWVEKVPESISRPVTWVPFWMRLGRRYVDAGQQIGRLDALSLEERRLWEFQRLKDIVQFAYTSIPFYHTRYKAAGFCPADLRTPEDWQNVPIITKAELQGTPLAERCGNTRGAMSANTGGTAGEPLLFLLDRHAFAREWAHMHAIWRARGYHPRQLKLTLRGKHFDRHVPLRFNAIHNEYVVNSNSRFEDVLAALGNLPPGRVIRWLHGYPSLVYEFARFLESSKPALRDVLRRRLFGVLLGSEFPAPHYRQKIEGVLSCNIVSWYGHSEMALLARETAVGIYESMPTYGYAEAVRSKDGDGSRSRLVCTSFYNRAHPFIRYDTGDVVEALSDEGQLLAFRIMDGRVGDFVIDRHGRRLALTAIVFGRHHKAFEVIRHLQVRQDATGRVTLLVTPQAWGLDVRTIRDGFDLDDLDLDWEVEFLDAPLRTAAGKIRLKVDAA